MKRLYLLPILLILCAYALPFANTLQLNGAGIVNGPYLSLAENQTIHGGILYDIFKEVWRKLNVTVSYEPITDIPTESNTSLAKLVGNGTYDFVMGYPLDQSDASDLSDFDNVDRVDIIRDSVVVFTPKLLQLLVSNVFREMFFVFCIAFLPWILVNTSLYYLIERHRFTRMSFFSAYFECFKTILYHGKKMSKVAKVYSILFYGISIIMIMLLLGDFIYVIAAMMMKIDIDDLNQVVNSQSKTCIVEGDYLVEGFINRRQEITNIKTNDVLSCFLELDSLNVGSFMVSGSKVKSFFRNHPTLNNKFNYFVKDSINVDYYLLINRDFRLRDDINRVINRFPDFFIPNVIGKYFKSPSYNQIIPTSIFSDSTLLMFLSLTITSIFLIFFMVMMIVYKAKPKSKKVKHSKVKKAKKSYGEEKLDKYRLALQRSNESKQKLSQNDSDELKNKETQGATASHCQQYQKLQQFQRQNTYTRSSQATDTDRNTLSLNSSINYRHCDANNDANYRRSHPQISDEERSLNFREMPDIENQISPIQKIEGSVLRF